MAKPTVIDHTILMEQITEGQRVRQYVLERLAGDRWTQLAHGQSIGHKRIERFQPVELTKIRLRVTETAAEPIIRRLAVFHVGPTTSPKPTLSKPTAAAKPSGWGVRQVLVGDPTLPHVLLIGDSILGGYLEINYPPSSQQGELQLGVTYTLWIPDGVAKLRGIIIHQHGCGSGACKGGETAAYDLHWQALARKWDCVLLGPSYQQDAEQNCRLWCDPRNGSANRIRPSK